MTLNPLLFFSFIEWKESVFDFIKFVQRISCDPLKFTRRLANLIDIAFRDPSLIPNDGNYWRGKSIVYVSSMPRWNDVKTTVYKILVKIYVKPALIGENRNFSKSARIMLVKASITFSCRKKLEFIPYFWVNTGSFLFELPFRHISSLGWTEMSSILRNNCTDQWYQFNWNA